MSATHTRPEDPNLALAKAMGSKRGYDPMPPDQHEWQRTKGEPTKYRLWSWLCAHTIHARDVGNRKLRTAYATADDCITAVTLKHAAEDLDIDLGQLSRAWQEGEAAGLWRRDGKTRRLYLNGNVTAEQVMRSKQRAALDSTINLSATDLLKIKALPKDAQAVTLARLTASKEYHEAKLAAEVAAVREAWAACDDSILAAVAIEKKRMGRRAPTPPEVPQLLFEFVQSTAEQSVAPDRTVGENDGEKLTVPAPHPLGSRETLQRLEVGRSSGDSEQTDRPTAAEASAPEKTGEAASVKLTGADVEAALLEVLGDRLPDQMPGAAMCERIAAHLDDAPIERLKAGCRAKLAKFKSYGLAEEVARDVGNAWRAGKAARQQAAAAATARDAEQLAKHHSEAQAILANPRAAPEELRWARDVLSVKTKTVGGES